MIEFKLDILYQAIEKKTNIELRQLNKKDNNVLFFSKFLKYDNKNKKILLEFPPASSVLDVLKINDSIEIKFIYQESPYIFTSKILNLNNLDHSPEQKKHFMEIDFPDKIFGNERRNFLKLKTPPFDVSVTIIKSADFLKQLKNMTYQAISINISGGGIALEFKKKEWNLISGDILKLSIDLPNGAVSIDGKVLNTYYNEYSNKTSYGIQFIHQNIDKLHFNKSVKKIVRYVLKRERELLYRR